MPQSQARLASAQYTFAPASKQITFAGVPGFALEGLAEVFHVPSGKVIFDGYDDTGTLGATASGNVVTLAFDTTGTYTPPGGSATAYAAGDALRIIYNDLTRDDQLIVVTPTATGPQTVYPVKSFQQLVVDIISTTSINVQIDVSVDGTNWKLGSNNGIVGRLPNLYNNPGNANNDTGSQPFNTRVFDISPFRFFRLNVIALSAGSPVVNLLLKTAQSSIRDVFVQGGSLGVSLGGSTAQIGYIGVGQSYTETFAGTLAANATLPLSTRDSLFSPLAYNFFGVFVSSDQAGQAIIEVSTNSSTWVVADQRSIVAGTPLDFKVPVRARYYRVRYVNGATAATALTVLSSFSGS